MAASVERIDAASLARKLAAGEPFALLDVREPEERSICALPAPPRGANLHVPMGEIPARLDEVRDAIATAVGGLLVVYCHHGVRSMVVARWLSTRGLAPLANLDGGIDAWSIGVDPSVARY